MLVDRTRRIKVARLRAESRPLIRRGALLLEEALRTASLSGFDQGRLLLIRSLSLGVLRLDKSPMLVAQRLERRIAELARYAVHGAESRAAEAEAVYFHDRVDAVLSLIQRLGQGISGDGGRAWYWRRAVAGWDPSLAPNQAGRLLLGVILNADHGTPDLAQAFHRLIGTRGFDLLLHVLREQDGPALLRRWDWSDLGHSATAPSIPIPLVDVMPIPRTWRSTLKEWVIRWGPTDARSLWLAMLAVQSWRSGLTSPAEARAHAEGLLRTIMDAPTSSLAPSAPDPHVLRHGNVEPDRIGHGEEPGAVDISGEREGFPVRTANAGFWFLIPLLMRAGFGRAIEAHPEWLDAGIPQRLLSSLADRLAIPLDDPVRLWLSREAEGAIGRDASAPPEKTMWENDAVVAEWRTAIRRWSRLHARLGLANVVRRPGLVSWTDTHLDVWMTLSRVDLRIRRAGLDLDPGWVAWLGQVVRFYYGAEGGTYGTGGIDGR